MKAIFLSRIQVLLTNIQETCSQICAIKQRKKANDINDSRLSKSSCTYNHSRLESPDIYAEGGPYGTDSSYNTSTLKAPEHKPYTTPDHAERHTQTLSALTPLPSRSSHTSSPSPGDTTSTSASPTSSLTRGYTFDKGESDAKLCSEEEEEGVTGSRGGGMGMGEEPPDSDGGGGPGLGNQQNSPSR